MSRLTLTKDLPILESYEWLPQFDGDDQMSSAMPKLEISGLYNDVRMLQSAKGKTDAQRGLAPNVLYSGPYFGPSHEAGPSRGPAMVSYKRALSRAGYFPWRSFNDRFNLELENAVKRFQEDKGLKPTGNIGDKVHEALERTHRHAVDKKQWAFDRVAIELQEDAYYIKYPKASPVESIMDAMVEYMEACVFYKDRIGYNQLRPMDSFDIHPRDGFTADCSEWATGIYKWARSKTGLYVPDPNGRGYDGFGYTGTLLEHNSSRKITNGKFRVGDLGLYGESLWYTTHVVICVDEGTGIGDSIWGSHGSAAGPLWVRLKYRWDLLGVWRPLLLPERKDL